MEFQGEANLTVTNLPRGMNATFYPNPVKFPSGYNPANPWDIDAFAYLIVTVTPDTPLGRVTIITNGTILPHNEMERYYYVTVTELTLNVVPTGPCTGLGGPQIGNSTTTTSTTTSNAMGNPRIVTMVTTTTSVSTELVTVTSISVSTTTLPPTTQTYTVSTITLLPNTADSWSAYAMAASIVIAAVVLTVVLLPRRNK